MKKGQGWSDEQIEYLKIHYRTDRACDIAVVINKSVSGIHHKASNLKIGKDKEGFFEARSRATSGKSSGNFKNYRRKTPKGYYVRYVPDHPNASKNGLVMEHRLVVEEYLGVILPSEFVVHHINGNKADNRIENLAIMTNAAHTALHNYGGKKHESTDHHR